MRGALARSAAELVAARVPFVEATVVRAQRPASVRPGDAAIVRADGSLAGFVGGACAEASVRLQALRALETGEPLLLRILPGDEQAAGGPADEGAVTVQNPCLSGGALEIFLEPHLPPPRIVVAGETPVAEALADLAARLGYAVAAATGEQPAPDDAAVVVASHGRDEEGVLAAALAGGVPYVGLVASRVRGEAVRDSLDLPAALREQLHTPAGLDIGARTPGEIAVSILAEILACRSAGGSIAPLRAPAPERAAVAVDPVCGMEVAVAETTPHADHDGRRHYFCCEVCRARFAADPARHAAAP